MTTAVLLGGNGYIGRNFAQLWLKQDADLTVYVVSRSGKNHLADERIINVAADVTNFDDVVAKLPKKVDYIVDFIGRPEKDKQQFIMVNDKPAEVMSQLAERLGAKAMGFVGGVFGPKSFVAGKKAIIARLQTKAIPTAVVEPTVVYGNGRSDMIAKLVPLFKLLGLVIKNAKPVNVNEVGQTLLDRLLALGEQHETK